MRTKKVELLVFGGSTARLFYCYIDALGDWVIATFCGKGRMMPGRFLPPGRNEQPLLLWGGDWESSPKGVNSNNTKSLT